jgi:hypothetical protein
MGPAVSRVLIFDTFTGKKALTVKDPLSGKKREWIMYRRLIAVLTGLCFLVPALVWAEFAPQFKESSKGKTDLSKSAPTHGQVYKSKTTMEKAAQHKTVSKNRQMMERNPTNQQQSHKIIQGTVNE